MLTKIYAQLKTGSVKNVAMYGSKTLPSAPYVVIKPIEDSLGRGIVYKIFAHFDPDYQIYLEDYVRSELVELLDDFKATTRHGNYKVLELLEGETQVTPIINDDGTISMSRSFLSPSPITF